MITKIDRTVINQTEAKKISSSNFGGVYFGGYNYVRLEWEAEDGASGYNVYLGYHPLTKYKMNASAITDTFYEIKLPYYPSNIIEYFWVTKVVDEIESSIESDGKTFYIQQEQDFRAESVSPIEANDAFPETENIDETMKDVLSRVQADMKFVLQNAGTKCDIYMRRWGTDNFGVPCPCGDKTDADNEFTGRNKCYLCFGTGVVGGYYPPIEMFVSFNTKPAKNFKGTIYGLKVNQTYDAWSIASPILRSGDLIVRRYDGERYDIDQVEITDPIRGVPVSQNFGLSLLPYDDIKRLISLTTINEALAKLNDAAYNPLGRVNL